MLAKKEVSIYMMLGEWEVTRKNEKALTVEAQRPVQSLLAAGFHRTN
jgi:hypothetical protein